MSKDEQGRWPWDVSIATSRVGLERCMRALLETRSIITDSFRTAADIPLGRGVSSHLRVFIPEGKQEEFLEICKPESMCANGRISVGNYHPPPDGHPGREPEWKDPIDR